MVSILQFNSGMVKNKGDPPQTIRMFDYCDPNFNSDTNKIGVGTTVLVLRLKKYDHFYNSNAKNEDNQQM